MKIVRFESGLDTKYGVLQNKSIQVIEGAPYHDELKLSDQSYQLDNVKLIAPCTPTKILGVGLNYHSLAKATNATLPNAPMTSVKSSTALIGAEENIVYPESAYQVDYECELAVVIKDSTWLIPPEEAMEHVLGFTCFTNITTRHRRYQNQRLTQDTSDDAPSVAGPWIETDLDSDNLSLKIYLNGELKQQANTSDFIYSIPELISFVCGALTLRPGDIVGTGSPCSIASLSVGDVIEVKIDKIGALKNRVVER